MGRSSRRVSGAGHRTCASKLQAISLSLLLCLMLALMVAPVFAAEDCIAFDPTQVEAKLVNGNWTVVQGNMLMVNFGSNQANCQKAVSVIKYYKMNSQCFVGRPNPPFQYWLANGQSPVGPFAGEDCIKFNPNTAEVKQINGRWKIVDGNNWLFDFNTSQANAVTALGIIKKYGFTSVCYVGRPNAPMQYFRKDPLVLLPPKITPLPINPIIPVAQEDCLPTHPADVKAVQINGTWKVVDGNEWVLDFGANGQANAQKAVSIIKFYGMTSHCYVGRPNPPFQYWLVNGHAPEGAFPGEDSIPFDPSKLSVQQVNGTWKIIEGTSHWMFDFGANQANANAALAIIKKYGFTSVCYVGRPNAPMQYLRKDKPIQEDCLTTHPGNVQAVQINGTWKVVDGSEWVLDFGANGQANAQKAVSVIKYYGMTSHCYVGRPNPPFQYWLANGKSPVGAFTGEDCIPFDPTKLSVQQINGTWKIVEAPSHWMFDFGTNQANANTALAIIQKYGFTKTCYVGRPNAPMQYFRQ